MVPGTIIAYLLLAISSGKKWEELGLRWGKREEPMRKEESKKQDKGQKGLGDNWLELVSPLHLF